MIGIDIASIDRIKNMYEKFGRRAYERFLNDDEIELIKRFETAAGFWAAKEAAPFVHSKLASVNKTISGDEDKPIAVTIGWRKKK